MLQVYKGLDIVTNKVTEEERRLAPHHLLDIVKPVQRFTVVDFRNRALPIVSFLHSAKLRVTQILEVNTHNLWYYLNVLDVERKQWTCYRLLVRENIAVQD